MKYSYPILILALFVSCFFMENGFFLYFLIGLISALFLIPLNMDAYKAYCKVYELNANAANYAIPFMIDLVFWPVAMGAHALRQRAE